LDHLRRHVPADGEDRRQRRRPAPDLRRADREGRRRGQRRRHHVELREVPPLAEGRDRGPLPAAGGAGRPRHRRRHRGAARRLSPPDPAPAGFQASIFDMDGLLIDSEVLWHEAELEILGDRLGVPLDKAGGVRTTKGMFVDEVIDLILTKGSLKPGALGAIDLCAARGWPLAVASSSEYRLIDAALEHFDLRDRFTLIHSAEDEEYGKPHPAVYLTAASKLGAPPKRCLAWEDAPAGVLAAKAASMACIAVPESGEGTDPAFGLADLVVDSLADVDGAALGEVAG